MKIIVQFKYIYIILKTTAIPHVSAFSLAKYIFSCVFGICLVTLTKRNGEMGNFRDYANNARL